MNGFTPLGSPGPTDFSDLLADPAVQAGFGQGVDPAKWEAVINTMDAEATAQIAGELGLHALLDEGIADEQRKAAIIARLQRIAGIIGTIANIAV